MPSLTTMAQAPYKTLLMAEKSKTVKCSAVPTGTLISGTLQSLPQSRGGFSDFFFFLYANNISRGRGATPRLGDMKALRSRAKTNPNVGTRQPMPLLETEAACMPGLSGAPS